MDITPGAVDESTYRRAIGAFASGVGIVTTEDADGRPIGMTVSSFTALSAAPPSILVCVRRDARTHELIVSGGRYGVSLLGADAAPKALYCATRGGDKGLPPEWLDDADGFASPALRDALAVIDCEVADVFTSGTHSIVVGAVRAIGLAGHRRAADPLVHYRGTFRHLQRHLPPGAVAPLPIIEHEIF